MKDRIENFIKNNNIDLAGTGSDFNGQACVLCGYALYIGIDDYSELYSILYDLKTWVSSSNTLETLFIYSKKKNYAKWWEKEINRLKYNL